MCRRSREIVSGRIRPGLRSIGWGTLHAAGLDLIALSLGHASIVYPLRPIANSDRLDATEPDPLTLPGQAVHFAAESAGQGPVWTRRGYGPHSCRDRIGIGDVVAVTSSDLS
mgnify:CR=1 FL=1